MLLRRLQGERKGMGSALRAPDSLQQVMNPSIVIPQSVQIEDVSFYNGTIDFDKMKADGRKGVIVRAGQRYWIDSQYKTNVTGAKAAGLLTGNYWFYDSRDTPQNQAKLWWNTVKGERLDLFAVPDLEDGYNGQYANKASYKAFITEFQSLSGLPNDKIVIYSGYYWWNEHVGNDSFFAKYRLWLPWYAAASVVKVPAPWTESTLEMWQYQQTPDLNWWNGTPEQFAAKFGGVSEPETGGTMLYGKVSATALNIRSGPGTSYPDVGDLVKDDMLEATENIGGWWHLSKINGVETPNNYYASSSYILTVDPPAEPATLSIFATIPVTLVIDGVEYTGKAENIELVKRA